MVLAMSGVPGSAGRQWMAGAIRREEVRTLRTNSAGQCVIGVDAEYLVEWLLRKSTPVGDAAVRYMSQVSEVLRAKAVVVFPGMPYATQRLDGVVVGVRRGVDEATMQGVMERLKVACAAEAMVAPYWSVAQLAALRGQGCAYVTDVIGPVELLLFGGVDRVILEVDMDAGWLYVVRRTDLEAVATAHGVDVVHLVLGAGPPSRYLGLRGGNDAGYDDEAHYNVVERSLYHCPVLTAGGECVPVSSLPGLVPSATQPYCDVAATFGRALPRLLYYLLMHGALSPSLAWSFAVGAVFDGSDAASTTAAREQSRFIVPLRTQVVHQLAQTFLETPDNYTMVWVGGGAEEAVSLRRPPKIALDEWIVPSDGALPVTFLRVIAMSGNAVAPTPETVRYASPYAALCAVHLKTLDLLGYFTHGTQPEEGGSGESHYATALARCEHLEDGLADAAVLLIELVRTRTLHAEALEWLGTSRTDAASPGARVAVRVCSLFPLTDPRWRVVASGAGAQCAGFNELAVALHRSLRALVEAVAAGVLAANFPDGLGRVPALAAQLPFFSPPGPEAGIVMQYILESTEQPLLPAVARRFAGGAEDCVRHDLARLFSFWTEAVHLVRCLLEAEATRSDMSEALSDAERVMRERRRALGV